MYKIHRFQKQPPEVFCEKRCSQNFVKFTEKRLCHRLIFNKVAGLRREACNFIKRESLAHVFSCEFCVISKNSFLQNTSRRLLLGFAWSVYFRLTHFMQLVNCVKSFQIRRFCWSIFCCIQSEYSKIRTRKNSVFGHFSCSGLFLYPGPFLYLFLYSYLSYSCGVREQEYSGQVKSCVFFRDCVTYLLSSLTPREGNISIFEPFSFFS